MMVRIFDYGMNGEGVAKADGKIILVDGALVDEDVEIEIDSDNGNFATAKLKSIVNSSTNRTIPVCPYFNECGGCQLQHMAYPEQLKFKTNHVRKTIKKITGLDVCVKNTVACSNIFNYRNKMSFSVQKQCCGFLKEKSNDLVDIESCPLANQTINEVFGILKSYACSMKNDCIKNFVIRLIENQILVGVVTRKHIDLTDLFSTLSTRFNHLGLYEIINTRNDSVVLSGKVTHVGGIKEITVNNFGLTYSVDLLGFHQTNIEIQNKLYEKVLNYIDQNSVVVNGFSGQGLLTAILSKKAKHVTGIEINKSSHKSAENLKQSNNINNITNICGDFFKHFKNNKKQANTIILDPTKKGCGSQVMNEIKGIENIIYISCNPIALSKDLNVIKDDYIIEEIIPFDMFPNTTSVETLIKLKKKHLNAKHDWNTNSVSLWLCYDK